VHGSLAAFREQPHWNVRFFRRVANTSFLATFPSILCNHLHTHNRMYERIQNRGDELPPLLHWALESERRYDLLFPLSAATATFDRVDRLSSLAWLRISVPRPSYKIAKEWAILDSIPRFWDRHRQNECKDMK